MLTLLMMLQLFWFLECVKLYRNIFKTIGQTEKIKYIDHTVQCIACTRASFLFQMALNNKNSSGCTSQDMPEEEKEYISAGLHQKQRSERGHEGRNKQIRKPIDISLKHARAYLHQFTSSCFIYL